MKPNPLILAALGGALLFGCVEDTPMEPEEPEPNVALVHYWHFNNLPEGTIAGPVLPDVSLVSGAGITYPGTGTGYMDRTDGTDLNARPGIPAGYALRVRNPASTRELVIVAPSTGYENLVVSYAVVRTANGAQFEEFYYSTNGGSSWTKVGATFSIGLDYASRSFDLSAVAAVNNNPNLRFRVLQVGDAAAGTSGNNRFDNLTVIGTAIAP
jgi:hypothetical protein